MGLTIDRNSHALVQAPFLWPVAEAGHPLSMIGTRLVHELARVGWEVPGIDVAFETVGRGKDVHCQVREVTGDIGDGPFSLRFCMEEGPKGGRSATTGLGFATVPPGIEIEFYSDRSGPVSYLYIGDDWKRDGKAFIDAAKVNSRLRDEPKTYLRYQGAGTWGDVLKHDDDLGREYRPEGHEPTVLSIRDVVANVEATVDAILERLRAMPDSRFVAEGKGEGVSGLLPDAGLSDLLPIESIPVPAGFPKLYAWADLNAIYRLRDEPQKASDDFGLAPSRRLLSLNYKPSFPVDPKVNDGYIYATTAARPGVRAGSSWHGSGRADMPVEIELSDLAEVYVVDRARYVRSREEHEKVARAEGRGSFSDREIADSFGAVAATIVPVLEYDGSFEDPVHVIRRELSRDEVRVMTGPLDLTSKGHGLAIVLTDEETGTEIDVATYLNDVEIVREQAERDLWELSMAIKTPRSSPCM